MIDIGEYNNVLCLLLNIVIETVLTRGWGGHKFARFTICRVLVPRGGGGDMKIGLGQA